MRGSQFGTGGAAVLDPPDGVNLYCYCGNDPINFEDPSGLEEYRVGRDGKSLTRRYSYIPGQQREDEALYGFRLGARGPGPGKWEDSGTGFSIDTRTGRVSGEEVWYPLDETAAGVVEEVRFKEWVAETEAGLKSDLANRRVSASELDSGVGSNVWVADGGWVGGTYVQDVSVGGENFKLVYGPAPRPGDAGEPYFRVWAVKWSSAGKATAQEAADIWFKYKKTALKGAAVATFVEASLLAVGEIAALRAVTAPARARVLPKAAETSQGAGGRAWRWGYGKINDEAAEAAYQAIRESTTDVAAISRYTGYKPDRLQRIKDYLFNNREWSGPDAETAAAWHRLRTGRGTETDRLLLKHETAEMWYGEGFSTSMALPTGERIRNGTGTKPIGIPE